MKSIQKLLEACVLRWRTPTSVPVVPRKDQKIPAYVDSVYDGDTCKIVFFHGGTYLKYSLRLEGVDAPEIKGPNVPVWETQAAVVVRDAVARRIRGKVVTVCLKKHDKYGGRIVGEVFYRTKGFKKNSLSSWLISEGLVKAYQGGKKKSWTKSECDRIVRRKGL